MDDQGDVKGRLAILHERNRIQEELLARIADEACRADDVSPSTKVVPLANVNLAIRRACQGVL